MSAALRTREGLVLAIRQVAKALQATVADQNPKSLTGTYRKCLPWEQAPQATPAYAQRCRLAEPAHVPSSVASELCS